MIITKLPNSEQSYKGKVKTHNYKYGSSIFSIMSSVNEFLEEILDTCGGLGRFQWLLLVSVIFGKISITWTTLMMSFGGAIPDWACQWGNGTEVYENIASKTQTCSPPTNYSELSCTRKMFDDSMNTVVNEVTMILILLSCIIPRFTMKTT